MLHYLIFCSNLNIISNYSADLSLFGNCHHNIIFGKINIQIPLPWALFVNSNAKNLEKLFGILIGKSLLKKKGKFFSWQKNWSSEWNILKIFRNYIPSKKIKFNYCQFQLMNENIKRWLKERSKLTKFFIRIKKRSQTKIRSKSCILHGVKNES